MEQNKFTAYLIRFKHATRNIQTVRVFAKTTEESKTKAWQEAKKQTWFKAGEWSIAGVYIKIEDGN